MTKVSGSLTCVATRIKELQKELSDAEWESSPNVDMLRHELEHFTNLMRRGILLEPDF